MIAVLELSKDQIEILKNISIGDDKSILENYYKIFIFFIIHLSTDIRQPAMYGLGILSKYLDYSHNNLKV